MSVGGDFLEEMRESLKKKPHTDLTKTEIREDIEDWGREQIAREALVQTGYSHRPLTKMTERKQLENLYVNIVHRNRKIQRYKAEAKLNELLKKAFREKLKEEGYDISSIKENIDLKNHELEIDNEYEDVDELKRKIKELNDDDLKEIKCLAEKRMEA